MGEAIEKAEPDQIEIKSEVDQLQADIYADNQHIIDEVAVIGGDLEDLDAVVVMAPIYSHRKPESYSGSNPDEFTLWIQKFRAVATAQDWGDDEAIGKLIPVYLTGHAFQVYSSLEANQKDTYENLIKNLKLKLGLGVNPLQWRLRLHRTNRESGETVDAFVLRLKNIVAHGYPDLKDSEAAFTAHVVEQYILGQPKDLRFHLLKKEGTPTLDELISSTKVYEMAAEIALGPKPVHTLDAVAVDAEQGLNNPSRTESSTNRLSETEGQVQTFNTAAWPVGGNRGHGRMNPQYSTDSRQNYGTRPGQQEFQRQQSFDCYRCGQPGHIARNCSAQGFSRAEGNPRICFKCRKPGHISRFCRSETVKNGKAKQEQLTANIQECCQRCGNRFHKAETCRTDISIVCQYCQKKGHRSEVCRSVPRQGLAIGGQPDYTAVTTSKNGLASVSEEVDWS